MDNCRGRNSSERCPQGNPLYVLRRVMRDTRPPNDVRQAKAQIAQIRALPPVR
jgi:hypothetical protein